MVRISTPIISPIENISIEGTMESLSEDDEQLYSTFREALSRLTRQPSSDSLRFILNYSKFLQERRK